VTRVELVVSELLTALPVIPAEVGEPLLAGLDLAPRRTIPAWASDPDFIASVLAGLVDIPDDLTGGAR